MIRKKDPRKLLGLSFSMHGNAYKIQGGSFWSGAKNKTIAVSWTGRMCQK